MHRQHKTKWEWAFNYILLYFDVLYLLCFIIYCFHISFVTCFDLLNFVGKQIEPSWTMLSGALCQLEEQVPTVETCTRLAADEKLGDLRTRYTR